MAGGHDQLWKDLIRTFPVDFLRLVDDDLTSWLEVSSLRLEPAQEFLDQPTGAERRMDLVGSAKTLEGNDVFVHVEIELRYRVKVPPRLWIYNRLLGLRRRLPVHTIVLYLRGGPRGPESSQYSETSCGREVGRLCYRSFGLSGARAETFLARTEPLAWAFAALGRTRDGDRHHLRRSCFAKIASADGLTDVERFLLFNCVATYLELGGGAVEEYVSLRARHRKPEVDMKPVTWEEKVEARGLETGMERGKENGMREVLLRLLRSRFPLLTGQVVARVEAIRSPEELGSLAERLLTARSLEELGLA
ncbi:MAG: hypothetical protein ABJC13_17565 [Acidobacteriota bacterium]